MIKILYIEDNEEDMDRLRDFFSPNRQYQIVAFTPRDVSELTDSINQNIPDYIIVDLSMNASDHSRMEVYLTANDNIPDNCPGDFCGGMAFIDHIHRHHRNYLTHDKLAIFTMHQREDNDPVFNIENLAQKWWDGFAPQIFSKVDEIHRLKKRIDSKFISIQCTEHVNKSPKRFFCVTNEEVFARDVEEAINALKQNYAIVEDLIIIAHHDFEKVLQEYSDDAKSNKIYDFAIIDITLTKEDEKLFDSVMSSSDTNAIEKLGNLTGVKLLDKIKQIHEKTVVIAVVKYKNRDLVRFLMQKIQTPSGEWIKRANFVIPQNSFELSIFGTLLHFID